MTALLKTYTCHLKTFGNPLVYRVSVYLEKDKSLLLKSKRDSFATLLSPVTICQDDQITTKNSTLNPTVRLLPQD